MYLDGGRAGATVPVYLDGGRAGATVPVYLDESPSTLSCVMKAYLNPIHLFHREQFLPRYLFHELLWITLDAN